MTSSFHDSYHTATCGTRARVFILCLFAFLLGLPVETKASLIINEVFNSNNRNREWIEFLVTTDITLGALDSIWFGDTNAATSSIDRSSRFVSSEIISNVSYFTSTSDIVRAGTIIVMGGTNVASDFTYNPNSNNPGDNGSWNLTLSNGIGFNTTVPVDLSGSSDLVWISTAQPANNSDTSNFLSAVAYLNANSATGGGAIADYVTTQSFADPAFQTIHRGSGGGYDGSLGNNRSISNFGDSDINFTNSEGTGSLGNPNGGLNTTYINTLRAVPEPGAIIPLSLLVLGGIYLQRRKRATRSLAPEKEAF